MREQPSAVELVQAVADFLREDALPRLDGLTAFHARVAVSLLEIVGRELRLGADADRQELSGLRALLGSEADLETLNLELCERIRGGEMDAGTSGLIAHLRLTTMNKLAVDQPGYSTYRRLKQQDLGEE